MNIEKMNEITRLFNELDGVIGFTFHENGFHVRHESLINESNLQIESRSSDDYPYEIYVQHDGFKVFAIIKNEQLKDFPQFKKRAKAELLRQLAYLEEDVDLSGGVEDVTA